MGDNNLSPTPWKMPFAAPSPSSSYPLESILCHSENQNIGSANKKHNRNNSVSSNEAPLPLDHSLQRLSSGEILTKETVDAAVALTTMATLNNLRRDTKAQESSK